MHLPGYNGAMKIKLFLLTSSVIIVGCYFGGGFTSISPSGSISAPDAEFMYLDLNEAYYDSLGVEPPLYEMNTTEDAGGSARRESVSNCELLYDEEEPAAPEIICIFDYMEEEFLLYELSFALNIPKGMCSSLIRAPSWHYNRPAGLGPSSITHSKSTVTGPSGPTEVDKYCLTDEPTRCVGTESEIVEDLCSYVHTEGDEKVNCCFGTYSITGETYSTGNSWGGKAQKCLGGPGRTSWEAYDDDGFPKPIIQYVLEDGLRLTFEIGDLIEVAQGGCYNTPIDNYMERFDKPVEELMEDFPDFPTFLQGGNGLRPAPPFYSFECRDSAGEILHRINLMIREWNTYEEFFAYYDSGGTDDTADPDVKGEEGEDCEYEERLPLRTDCLGVLDDCTTCCNDYLDLEDTIDLGLDYPEAYYR